MTRRIVVTGLGWITPLGHDIESAWKRILGGESGIAPTTIFDAGTFPTQFSSEVKKFDLAKLEPTVACHPNPGNRKLAKELSKQEAELRRRSSRIEEIDRALQRSSEEDIGAKSRRPSARRDAR